MSQTHPEHVAPEFHPENPNHTAETAGAIAEIHNPKPLLTTKEMKFGFRTIKDKDSGTESKRPNVEIKIDIPSFDGIVKILQNGGKQLELLHSVIEQTFSDYIKELLSEDESITTENFPFDKVSWEAIANMPETERKGRGIPKELWEEFIKDYLEIMPAATGKPIENVKAQAALLAAKLTPIKSAEKVRKERIITGIQNFLAIYMSASAKAEQFMDCITYLDKKCEAIRTTDSEANLEKNLGF